MLYASLLCIIRMTNDSETGKTNIYQYVVCDRLNGVNFPNPFLALHSLKIANECQYGVVIIGPVGHQRVNARVTVCIVR